MIKSLVNSVAHKYATSEGAQAAKARSRSSITSIIVRRLKFQTFIPSLLRDQSGANAVEYALIMALVGVFIISGVILMSTEIGTLFNSMAACLSDAVNCNAGTF